MPTLEKRISIQPAVQAVKRLDNNVLITSDNQNFEFDKIIFACHADEALTLLTDPSKEEELGVLGII